MHWYDVQPLVCCKSWVKLGLKALCLQAFEHARDLYSNVPRNLLRFNIRIAQIVIEVQRLLPDILSLQEVDRPADVVHSLENLGWVISA